MMHEGRFARPSEMVLSLTQRDARPTPRACRRMPRVIVEPSRAECAPSRSSPGRRLRRPPGPPAPAVGHGAGGDARRALRRSGTRGPVSLTSLLVSAARARHGAWPVVAFGAVRAGDSDAAASARGRGSCRGPKRRARHALVEFVRRGSRRTLMKFPGSDATSDEAARQRGNDEGSLRDVPVSSAVRVAR